MQTLLLAVFIGLGAVFVSLGLLGETSVVLAKGQALTEPAPSMQPPPSDDDLVIIVVFTDPLSIPITDLSGNIIGEGIHEGKARCNGNACNQKTELQFTVPLTDPVYTYKFSNRLALDPEARSVVVAGTGTISSNGHKERFSFTATFQDNGDGTVSATYVASRPDASFIIPRSPGKFTIVSRP
jgi:hypothetical protein